MIQLSHRYLMIISGLVWLAIGTTLLFVGLTFLVKGEGVLHRYFGDPNSVAILLIVFGLLLGRLKGKKVLARAAEKGCQRILTLPNPAPLWKIYKPSFYLMMATMISLGTLARSLPLDIRGFIDVTIGTALVQGALAYFLFMIRRAPSDFEGAK